MKIQGWSLEEVSYSCPPGPHAPGLIQSKWTITIEWQAGSQILLFPVALSSTSAMPPVGLHLWAPIPTSGECGRQQAIHPLLNLGQRQERATLGPLASGHQMPALDS